MIKVGEIGDRCDGCGLGEGSYGWSRPGTRTGKARVNSCLGQQRLELGDG